MPTWDAKQYLRFNEQRTRPCRELAARIAITAPERVIDLRQYLERIQAAYPARRDGRVIFPFHRLFLIAYQRLG